MLKTLPPVATRIGPREQQAGLRNDRLKATGFSLLGRAFARIRDRSWGKWRLGTGAGMRHWGTGAVECGIRGTRGLECGHKGDY